MASNHSKATWRTRTRLYLLCICLTLAFACATFLPHKGFGPVAAENNRVTREGRLAVFDDVWSTINQRYYDRNFQGLDCKHSEPPTETWQQTLKIIGNF